MKLKNQNLYSPMKENERERESIIAHALMFIINAFESNEMAIESEKTKLRCYVTRIADGNRVCVCVSILYVSMRCSKIPFHSFRLVELRCALLPRKKTARSLYFFSFFNS